MSVETTEVNMGGAVFFGKGDPGYTPVRGVDYWTDEDRQGILSEAQYDLSADVEAAKKSLTATGNQLVTDAKNEADRAQRASTAAQSAAARSDTNAASAAQSSTSAVDSARSAAESASTATTAAETATAKATAAAGSASAAQSAKTAAETAKASAESAKTAAEAAQTAAEASQSASAASATSAAQSAQTAQTKAQEIAESAGQIEQNKTDIAGLRTDMTGLETRIDNIDDVIIETVEPLQKQVNNNERSLNALWKLNEGQTYDIETVEETGINEAPSGAKYMTPEEIYGKTEQESTNGYQLLEPTGGVISGRSQIEEDGAITVLPVTLGRYMLAYSKEISDYLQGSGSYTLSVSEGVYDGLFAQILFEHTDGSKQYLSTAQRTPSTLAVDTSDLTRATCSIQAGADGAVVSSDTTFHVMLEKGTIAHDYEPYTGGIPAPNPDFPEPIHSVEAIRIERNELSRTIIPPKPLNAIGEYKDVLDVTNGVWRYVFKEASGLIWTKASVGESTFQASVSDFPMQTANISPAVLTTDYRRVFTQASMSNIAASGDMIVTCHNRVNGIWINDSRFTDLTAFRQAIADKTFIYASDAEVTIPIDPDDLDFLRSLATVPATDHIIITDQDGNDVPWLNEYIISLREVANNG